MYKMIIAREKKTQEIDTVCDCEVDFSVVYAIISMAKLFSEQTLVIFQADLT